MSLNERLIGAGAVACTADTTDVFGDGSGIALYTMDYDASDASGSYDGTPTNVEFGVEGQINYGARFNGTSAYISTGGSIVNSLTSITVAGWFYTEPNTNYSYGLHFGTISTGGDAISISRWNNTAFGEFGAYTLYANIGSGNVDGNYTLNENTWYHIAITWTGTTMKFYVNGNLETTATTSSLSIPASGNSGYIGRYIINQSFNWKGSIDQVRLFSKALNQTEVDTLYAETACVYTCTTDTLDYPTTNVAYYKLDNSAEDETGAYDGTATNVNYTFGRFGQAAVFNGSSSYIDIDNIGGISGASSEVSISTWFNFSGASGDRYIISLRDGCLAEIGFNSGYSPRKLEFKIFDGGNKTVLVDESLITNNNWHHIVLTAESGGLLTAYLDGVSQGTISIGTISNITQNNTIGGYNISGTAAGFFSGKIDQVRIFDSALTSTQVTELYEEYECEDTSNFKAVLYEGNDATKHFISNVGLDLDVDNGGAGGLVWVKNRDNAFNHILVDSIRGANNLLFSDTSAVPLTSNTTLLSSLEKTGFFVGYDGTDVTNGASNSYVAWVWKGGGDAVSNTDGTITSQVSANTAAGFSIATYTGVGYPNSSTAEVGHGLSQAPELVFIKGTGGTGQSGGAGSWVVGTGVLASNNWAGSMYLNSNAAYYTAVNYFWNGAATDSVVKLKNDWFVNGTNNQYVMYSWHSVAGYSKIGTYIGNGNATGTIVNLDFAPSFVMIKGTDQTSDWIMVDNKRDPTNPNSARLDANSSGQEVSDTIMDLNSFTNSFYDGFQLKTSSAAKNGLGKVFIYMAFA